VKYTFMKNEFQSFGPVGDRPLGKSSRLGCLIQEMSFTVITKCRNSYFLRLLRYKGLCRERLTHVPRNFEGTKFDIVKEETGFRTTVARQTPEECTCDQGDAFQRFNRDPWVGHKVHLIVLGPHYRVMGIQLPERLRPKLLLARG
jgi:hypothetical protein